MSAGELAAFLADRYDEAEGIAQGLMGATRFIEGNPDFYGIGGPAAEAFWNHFTPIRMLADINLKRAILAEHQPGSDGNCATCVDRNAEHPVIIDLWLPAGWPCATVRQLGTEFAGHPAYKAEWKP